MIDKTKVVITKCHRWSYFEWFLLGLYKLEKSGEIDLCIRNNIGSYFLSKCSNEFVSGCIRKAISFFERDSYNLCGYIKGKQNNKKIFCIDSADSPFIFNRSDLENSDIYFKMQYPVDLDSESQFFYLTDDIKIPWLDYALDSKEQGNMPTPFDMTTGYRKKIKPLMVGTRELSKSISYKALRNAYDNYLKNQTVLKDKKYMCYFGDSKGPVASPKAVHFNEDKESELMKKYEGRINHPNEKRAIVAEILKEKYQDADVRIIHRGNSDSGNRHINAEPIPLDQFCKHISRFQYNINVSGYRLSIPNRFIESFMVGTAIITDKLHVRWYKDFENEVVETIEMGYLTNERVKWSDFTNLILNISENSPNSVINSYNSKWSPEAVAKYIIDTIKES